MVNWHGKTEIKGIRKQLRWQFLPSLTRWLYDRAWFCRVQKFCSISFQNLHSVTLQLSRPLLVILMRLHVFLLCFSLCFALIFVFCSVFPILFWFSCIGLFFALCCFVLLFFAFCCFLLCFSLCFSLCFLQCFLFCFSKLLLCFAFPAYFALRLAALLLWWLSAAVHLHVHTLTSRQWPVNTYLIIHIPPTRPIFRKNFFC